MFTTETTGFEIPKDLDLTNRFYVASGFIDADYKTSIIIDKANMINHRALDLRKLPGGRSDMYAFYEDRYRLTLKYLLHEYCFSRIQIEKILERESTIVRHPVERTAIIEFLEATAWFPFEFYYAGWNVRDNLRRSGEATETTQFAFLVNSVVDIDPHASELECTNRIRMLPNSVNWLRSKNTSIQEMRIIYGVPEARRSVINAHKVLFDMICDFKCIREEKFAIHMYKIKSQ